MGKVIKSTIAYKKEDLFEVEAGPVSVILEYINCIKTDTVDNFDSSATQFTQLIHFAAI